MTDRRQRAGRHGQLPTGSTSRSRETSMSTMCLASTPPARRSQPIVRGLNRRRDSEQKRRGGQRQNHDACRPSRAVARQRLRARNYAQKRRRRERDDTTLPQPIQHAVHSQFLYASSITFFRRASSSGVDLFVLEDVEHKQARRPVEQARHQVPKRPATRLTFVNARPKDERPTDFLMRHVSFAF